MSSVIHASKEDQVIIPGQQYEMPDKPVSEDPAYKGSGKLDNKVAIITGGDSGIGRATAIAFAKEGADVAIVYLSEEKDAETSKQMVESYGKDCLTIKGDLRDEKFCKQVVQKTFDKFGHIDVLVNNAGHHEPQDSLEDISREQLESIFAANFYSIVSLTQQCLPKLKAGSSIINTASVTAYKGSGHLLDYSASKGAIVSFTRSLSQKLASKGIRVNAVAPGPVWTPLIYETFSEAEQKEFGKNVPMGRPAQPFEIAPSFVFLASNDAAYMTGQVLHPNGGTIVNG